MVLVGIEKTRLLLLLIISLSISICIGIRTRMLLLLLVMVVLIAVSVSVLFGCMVVALCCVQVILFLTCIRTTIFLLIGLILSSSVSLVVSFLFSNIHYIVTKYN